MKHLISMATGFALFATTAFAAESDKPNIVFILADDMGYADLSGYGAEKINTPNIDRLAKEGILFSDAHEDFEFNAPVLRKWVQLARQGKLTGPQAMLNLGYKPIEELYDSENDPHMINGVIDDPQHAIIAALRKAASEVDVKKMRGISCRLNQPFRRAIKAITGQETYYRW